MEMRDAAFPVPAELTRLDGSLRYQPHDLSIARVERAYGKLGQAPTACDSASTRNSAIT